MKHSLLPLALMIASCGKIDMGSTGALGTVRQLQTNNITTGEAVVFDQVCQALTKKGDKLSATLPNSLNFDVVEKNCDGGNVFFGTQQVRVENTGSGFQFRRSDNNTLFVFPEVETSSSGFMKEICGGASSLPVSRGSEVIWVSQAGFSNVDCPNAPSERCLMVEYGLKVDSGENLYRVHRRDFVRVNLTTSSGKYGYVTYRKSTAENNCDQGKSTVTTAELR